MYIIHLKPDQPKSLPERIDEGWWGQKTGFRSVDRHEIVKQKSVEELNAQLVSLVGENGGRDANQCFQKQEKYIKP